MEDRGADREAGDAANRETGGDEEETLTAERARVLIAGGDANVLDIRSEEEWRTVGNIPGAMHVPDDKLESRLDEVPKDERLVVVCRDGNRSADVAGQLRERDYEAASIEGGMEAWEDEGYPMQPSEDPDLPSKDVDLRSEGAEAAESSPERSQP
jgi:rhodanese-related sulfurtransferase